MVRRFDNYYVYEKGVREAGLARFEGYDDDDNSICEDVCYTDDDLVILGRNYTESDRAAVEEFAESYECKVEW